MMVARKYLPNNGNTADYFNKGSQPTSFAYTSEKVLNEVFADTEWDFNSNSGENEDLSYVEETDNENQQKNLKLMNSWLKMTIKKTHVDMAMELRVFKAVVEATTSDNEQKGFKWTLLNHIKKGIQIIFCF